MVSTFKFAPDTSGLRCGVLIESNLDDELVYEVHVIILERLKGNKKINLFIEIRTGSTISLITFLKDQVFTLKYTGQFHKITW